ncbi:ECF transporter S component [Clostridium sp. BJN0001]|uniref:ECF transporter S component n=1 Tax=Clostridium sp. BJN0001 TaxID=2930219 RepID=UPI001FD1EC67|nr:ECF transporter S component [Clostridium sp. BJN0001]
MNNKIKQMTYAGLLTAFAIIIPIQFGFLRVVIGTYTATLCAHVPMILSMLISPFVAVVVGIGSTIGFLIAGCPLPVVCRAATHIIVGLIGAEIILRRKNFLEAVTITAPIHGILEMLVSIPFIGVTAYPLLIITLVGCVIHHSVDSIISYFFIKSLSKIKKTDIYNVFGDFSVNVSK